MKRHLPLAAIVAMLATTPIAAHAQGLPGPAGQDFQIFTFGNFSAYSSGGGGRIGVGGNADFTEFNPGSNLSNSFYAPGQRQANVTYGSRADLIVAGNVNDQNISAGQPGSANTPGLVPNGDVRYGGAVTTGNLGQTPVSAASLPENFIQGSTIDFGQAATGYKQLSANLGAQADSTGVTLDFTPKVPDNSDKSQGYFVVKVDPSIKNQTVFANVNVADYNSYAYFGPGTFHYIGVSADASDTVVINLKGSATDIYGNTGVGFFKSYQVGENGANTADLNKVLINITDATKVSGNGSTVLGHYLAPDANIQFDNNSVSAEGTFISQSFYSSGNGFVYKPSDAFTGDLSAYDQGINFGTITPENAPAAAPEPGSWASIGLGSLSLLGLAVRARRRA